MLSPAAIILPEISQPGLAAGIGWAAKKVVKENFTSDPSSSAMNYVKFSVVMAGSTALEDQIDPGREFMGAVTNENHKTYICRGRTEIHRDQAIVERFNRTQA